MQRIILAFVIAGTITAFNGTANAFELSPKGTRYEQHVSEQNSGWFDRMVSALIASGLPLLRDSVHEEITNRMSGCQGDATVCNDPDSEYGGSYILAGARWDDDPISYKK